MPKAKYGNAHQKLRRAGLKAAIGKPCVRCGLPMLPGQLLDLDHRDDGNGWLGFSHAFCNRSAGAKRKRRARTLDMCNLGLQISQDRQHTSIAVAGFIGDDIVEVKLCVYLDGGADPEADLLRLMAEYGARRVAVDPDSQSATVIKPLMKAGIRVVQLSTTDRKVAQGQFRDGLNNTGRVKAFSPHPLLTLAVQYGENQTKGGAEVWQRRGVPVDVGPLDACTWAAWAVLNKPAAPKIY